MNNKLFLNRANSVANLLIQQNVSVICLYVYGAAASQPIASNKTASGCAENRQVICF